MSFPLKFDKSVLQEFGAGFMVYVEKHKLLDVISRALAEISLQPPEDIRYWLGANIRRIAQGIYAKALDAFYRGEQGEGFQLRKNFYHRIVLHGRPGSGRHSLAQELSKRWNLLILDADVLAYHHINGYQQDEYAKQLQLGIERDCVYTRSEAIGNIIRKRLLQDDALHRGWILYNYPNNSCEARELFEGFTVPPNRFVFLQIDERMARMRVVTKPYAPDPQNNFIYLDRQMQQFRKSEPALNAYLSHRREVIYIDATRCFEEVKCHIMSQLTKTPYMVGYKFGDVTVSD
ncbi:uncharacterized protein LOC115621521 [Scaptodrosophila lebanonensis]|uniref:Uncharacterized protein LOC115621521 n=1 Tax=Drosophila lebanonensis TaxID=7225 RepID=A0A6J2T2B0_DROLE|nr:uncharacterized protein LOC115621521 [Scaptodrosophila lebanonensis]